MAIGRLRDLFANDIHDIRTTHSQATHNRLVQCQCNERTEHELIAMLDEERLRYVGAMVLGLNDALVELTGTLAGLTLALRDTQLIGTAGLITGIAASLSMAASQHLSTESGDDDLDPGKASLWPGDIKPFGGGRREPTHPKHPDTSSGGLDKRPPLSTLAHAKARAQQVSDYFMP